jgi:hypothetical protein
MSQFTEVADSTFHSLILRTTIQGGHINLLTTMGTICSKESASRALFGLNGVAHPPYDTLRLKGSVACLIEVSASPYLGKADPQLTKLER